MGMIQDSSVVDHFLQVIHSFSTGCVEKGTVAHWSQVDV